MSDPSTSSDSIDYNLGMLAQLEEDLERPADRRVNKMTDKQLRRMIDRVKGIMSGKPAQRLNAEQVTEQLAAKWVERFSDAYWQDFAMRSIRRQ